MLLLSPHVSHKDAVWLVDAKPPSPSPSRLRNTGRSSRGSGRPTSGRAAQTCPDDQTRRRWGDRSPPLRPWSDQPALCVHMGAAISGAGCRGIGGQTWPWARAAPGSPAGAARHWSSTGLIGDGKGCFQGAKMTEVSVDVVGRSASNFAGAACRVTAPGSLFGPGSR